MGHRMLSHLVGLLSENKNKLHGLGYFGFRFDCFKHEDGLHSALFQWSSHLLHDYRDCRRALAYSQFTAILDLFYAAVVVGHPVFQRISVLLKLMRSNFL